VANAVAVTTAEDTAASGTLAASASDVEGDALSFSLVAGPANGSVVVNADGTYTYTPNANYFGPDSFTYRVNDGTLDSNVATVSITVLADGVPTNIVPGAQAVNEDAILVLSGASAPQVADSDSPALTVTLSVSNGTVSLGSTSGLAFASGDGNADATMTFSGSVADINAALDGLAYAPAADYNGPATLTLSATDGTSTDVDTVSISVNPVNDAPVASSTAAAVGEDGVLAGALPAATDADPDALTYSVASAPLNGTLLLNADGTYTYTPNANYFGPDSFTYEVFDGTAFSAPATVTITVTPVNDAPVASPAAVAASEDTPLNGTLPAATDADLDALTYAKVSDPANGTVVVNADGSYTYTPNPDFNGVDSFTYRVNDGSLDSAVATVTITVAGVNDAPSASDASVSVAEDAVLNGALPAGADVELDALTFVKVSDPANGTLVLNADGTYTYTPNANYSGPDSFTYRVNDGSADSNAATVTISVTPVNDAPSVSSLAVALNEDSVLSGTLPAATDADFDALTYSVVSLPANGTLVLNADGTYAYTPAANWSGVDAFTFKVNDGTADSAVATVTITVLAVNDAPVAVAVLPDRAIAPASGFSFALPAGAFSDADSALALTATRADGSPLPAWLAFDPATGSFSGTAPAGFGALSVRVTASDGTLAASSTFTLTEQVLSIPAQAHDVAPRFQGDAPRPPLQPAGAPLATGGAAAPHAPAFPDLALGQAVDTTVPASNLGIAAGERGTAPAPAPFDLNALPPTAAGPADPHGFAVVRVSALEAASFVASRDGGPLAFGGHRLFVFHGIPSAQLARDGFGAVQVPEDAFAHTDPSAVVRLEARLADGSPLPAWLTFDRSRGTFHGVPPADVRGSLEIEVIARDDQGREARTRFEMLVDDLRAQDLQRLGVMPDLVLGLDVDAKEKEKARLRAEAEKARGDAKPGPVRAPGEAQPRPAASFTDQMRTAKGSGDPLLDRIAKATRDTPPNRK
jgi:VCBS repeat-containing protein